MSRLVHSSVWLQQARAILRQGRWAGLLVASVVLLGALAQYVAAMGAVDEVASAELRIVVIPAGAADTSTLLAARRDAEQIALQLSHGGALSDPALDAAIAGAAALPGVTPPDVGEALSATSTGSLVTLTARWRTADGAEKLAAAAAKVLGAGGLRSAAAVEPLVPAGALVRAQVTRPAGAAQPDAAQQDEARRALAVRFALSVVAGLLAAAGWGYFASARRVKTQSS